MEERVRENLNHYNDLLTRKERLIRPYINKKNSVEVVLGDEKWTMRDAEEYTRLYTEINMLKEHIADLEYILGN